MTTQLQLINIIIIIIIIIIHRLLNLPRLDVWLTANGTQKMLKGCKTGLDKDAKANNYRVILARPQKDSISGFSKWCLIPFYFNGLYSNQNTPETDFI